MPRTEIDYSQTIIYQISCKDASVFDFFIGHTTNFTKRKCYHKQECMRRKTHHPMYATINAHGGWENWTMAEIARHHCVNASDAKARENQYYDAILRAKKSPSQLSDPTLSNSDQLSLGNRTETAHVRAKQWMRCDCGKAYLTKSGLWKHRQSCVDVRAIALCDDNREPDPPCQERDIQALTQLVLEVVKQNNDLANKIVDLCKTSQGPTCNVNSNNNHVILNTQTNHFNLNVFLNETCKYAMNINDFVESIQLDLADLENVGKLGFVEGISSIIVKNLKALDVTERPIHCADKKREIIYIKDEDKWEREDEDKKKLKKVIKKVAYKNERLLPQYKQKYPDYNDAESKRSDQYSKLVIEAMGGVGDNDAEKEEKILKKIAKEVVIDKSLAQGL